MHRDTDADRHPGNRDLLKSLQIHLVRLTGTAALFRVRQTQKPNLAQHGKGIAREPRRCLLCGSSRRQLSLCKLPDH